MNYLSQDYISFFQELEENNAKEWFDDNRKRYESSVKKPFQALVQTLLDRLPDLDPEIHMTSRDAIFRINRDIRFAKDKTPYNIMMKAGFARAGRKSPYAGYYLGISAQQIHVGGGVYMIDSSNLKKIRNHIATNADEMNALATAPSFTSRFTEIQGDRIKRIPKDFKEVVETAPWVANKSFHYMADFPTESYLDDSRLIQLIWDHFEAATPINRFLKEALE